MTSLLTRTVRAALVHLVIVAGASAQDEPPYSSIRFAEDEMVPVRDGIRLATDVYRPAFGNDPVSEPLPVLLHRTPYDKTSRSLVAQARYFAEHGYVVIVQDTRGRYKSEGIFSKYHKYDALDGFDVLAWIETLDYTNGRVGMWGTSYGAHTQADAAKLDPPQLATLLLNMGGISNGWAHKVRNHGAFELAQQLGWAFQQLAAETDDSVVRRMLEVERVEDWFHAQPLRRGLNPLSIVPNFEDYVIEISTRADYDDYWKELGVNWVEHYDNTADIPMLHVSGWYDTYVGSTIENFVGLSTAKRAPMYLLIGPWDHGGNERSWAGDVEFGHDAAFEDFHRVFHLHWFDYWLRGSDPVIEAWPRVRVFVMGTGDGHRDENGRLFHGGYWRDARAWPLEDAEPVQFYFHEDGTLRRAPPSAGTTPTTYAYDPARPVPTIGGSFSGALKRGPYDQREREFKRLGGRSDNGFYGSRPPYLPLRARSDVVVFQTEPLPEDVTVIGPVTVRLYASSSARDTDFTAKLVDVYPASEEFPSGFEMNVTDGIVRARYRTDPEGAELLEPGRVYEFVIEPFPTANVFKRGHRIRIDISSSNFPRFDVNPNTGDPLGRHRRRIIAENTVYHEATHPSHVVLWIAPNRPEG